MKKRFLILAIAIVTFSNVYSQTKSEKSDYLGKWDIIMLALPDGDTKSQLFITDTDGKLGGFLKFDEPAGNVATIVNPEIKNSILTFRATLQNYDIDFTFERTNDGLIKGSMYNNMFFITGKKSEATSPGK